MDAAVKHCTSGIGIWEWASNDMGSEPDVVMACCGDVPTIETLAAVEILREKVPDLKIRVINVVDMMTLQPQEEHPHGLSPAATLGGLDTLVFTGGIGEKTAPFRLSVCRRLAHLGILLDEGRNATNADPASSAESPCIVRIVPTNEDLIIARHSFRIVAT